MYPLDMGKSERLLLDLAGENRAVSGPHNDKTVRAISYNILCFSRAGGSRTHMDLRPADFK